jgi:hypothetical protein
MARIKKGVLGGLSGKVGNVIGGKVRGTDYLRSLPTGNTNANTILQQAQRAKFATVINFLKPMRDIVRIGFKPEAGRNSGFNAAMSYNFHHALVGDFDTGFAIDFVKALIASGDLPSVEGATLASTVARQIDLTWDNNATEALAGEQDALYLGVFNSEEGIGLSRINYAQRVDGALSVLLPPSYSGETVHCFAGFFGSQYAVSSPTLQMVSRSVYIGSVVVA